MFFRRKPKKSAPISGEDGCYYAEEGEDYDSDEFETDSDYSYNSLDDHELNNAKDPAMDVDNDNDNDNEVVEEIQQQDEYKSDGKKEEPEESQVSTASYVIVAKDTVTETIPSVEVEFQESMAIVHGIKEESERQIPDAEEKKLELESESESDLESFTASDLRHSPESSGLETVNLNEDASESPSKANMEIKSSIQTSKNLPSSAKGVQQSTSLHEKRSLLALAAEHDRVDIIKTILQPNPNCDNVALAQLLLNNRIDIDKKSQLYTEEDDLELVFIPPLHIAIASSATNAASCLLRMGSNPAIRPNIPIEWKGPDWKDGKGTTVATGKKWNVFNDVTAWELAFGTTRINPEDLAGKKGWFGFKPSNKLEDDFPKLYMPIKIDPAKLEGIKHAFTAEALRAIGSDEVVRLGELLDSGLGSIERIEIGGKDLNGWCHEMSASKCIQMLEARYSVATYESDNAKEDDDKVNDTSEGEHENKENILESEEEDSHVVYDQSTLLDLENKVEESESLATALSAMLDNLAEEVSLTQGLLMQPGGDSNTALLSQVRLLKKQRADVDDKIGHCEACLSDRYAEHDMCTMWWLKRGGSLNEIPIRPSLAAKVDQVVPIENAPIEIKELVQKATKQFTLSGKKVKKLRASIAELSSENARNLEEVEKLGLQGAVKLTRKLKDEVREQKMALETVVREESSVRARVAMLREMLEREQVPRKEATSPKERGASSQDIDINADAVPSIIEEVRPESPVLEEMIRPDDSYDSSDVSFDTIDGDSSYSDESESDSDSYDSGEESDEMPHSEAIKRGHSAAIVKWTDDEDLGVFTFKIWNLLQKMFGLSRKAIKKTAAATVNEVVNIPRVLII